VWESGPAYGNSGIESWINKKKLEKPSLNVAPTISATFFSSDLELCPMTLTMNLTKIWSKWTNMLNILVQMSFRLKLGVYSVRVCVCVHVCFDRMFRWRQWVVVVRTQVQRQLTSVSYQPRYHVKCLSERRQHRVCICSLTISLCSQFVAAFRSVVSDILLMVLHWQIVGYSADSHFESYSRQNVCLHGMAPSYLGPWVLILDLESLCMCVTHM